MFKKLFTLFVLLSFIIIGFVHNSMMAFAMQDGMKMEMMGKMSMDCCEENNCNNECCFTSDLEKKIYFSNISTSKKILKIKIVGFVDIFSVKTSILENKNLVKKTSPPNIEQKIKLYSYSDLIKIIKSNT